MDKNRIGLILEAAGVVSVLVGVIAGVHHLLIAVPVGGGLLAIYVGKLFRAGRI